MSIPFKSISPLNQKARASYKFISNKSLEKVLKQSHLASIEAKKQGYDGIQHRLQKLAKVRDLFMERKDDLAEEATQEMGKVITQSKGEVQKCIAHFDYIIQNAEEFSKPEKLVSIFDQAYVVPQPLGPILSIKPWNFPFWQALKLQVPSLILGHPIIYKPAPSIPNCSLMLDEIFKEAGFSNGEYEVVFADHIQCEKLLADPRVSAVKFVGSTEGGKSVAVQAAQHMKRSTFELGGSDPFIITAQADLDLAVTKALASRLLNNGQACNNAKRFIVHKSIYKQFLDLLYEKLSKQIVGDPMDADTNIGPLAINRLYLKVLEQVKEAVRQGAKLHYGSLEWKIWRKDYQKGNFMQPMVLKGIKPNHKAFVEEFFGPVFLTFSYDDVEDALKLANATQYGLSGAVFSKDEAEAKYIAEGLECGQVFVNDMVQSDSSLPGGGIKDSGYARPGNKEAFLEVCNKKLIVYKH